MRIFIAKCLGWFVYPATDLLNWLDPDKRHLTTNYSSRAAGSAVVLKTLDRAPMAGVNIRYDMGPDGKPRKDKQGRWIVK